MALFVEGMVCQICGKSMRKEQEIISFPSIISNTLDPLYLFNDGAFHAACFYRHPLANAMQKRTKEWQAQVEVWPPICAICNKAITNPDQHFTFGHLTEDQTSPLHKYNYKQFHRSCLKDWSELPSVVSWLEQLEQSGSWGGSFLNTMLSDINKIKAS